MLPETIVVAVVENDSWKRNAAKIWPIKGSSTSGSIKKSPIAINGLVNGPEI